MKANKARTYFSALWLVFTFSLVSWWFILNLRGLPSNEAQAQAEINQRNRMYFWEGSTLLLTVLLGGGLLIVLSRREEKRNESLRYFFANFSHDIKTSISRLRLQAEILSEESSLKKDGSENKVLKRLLTDISRLDLQLENSLLLSHQAEFKFLMQKIELQPLVHSLQIEFPDLKIQLKPEEGARSLQVLADSRALKSIFRNLVENARRHGHATEIEIRSRVLANSKVKIEIHDNGSGSQVALSSLGREITPQSAGSGNGIGLYLCRYLIRKMDGDIEFVASPFQGFCCEITLSGAVT